MEETIRVIRAIRMIERNRVEVERKEILQREEDMIQID